MQHIADLWHEIASKAMCIRAALLLIALTSGIGSVATAQVPRQEESLPAEFSIRAEPSFRDYETVLRRFVRKHHLAAPNDFCVLGQVADDNTKSAWVLWHQGRQVILWDGDGSDLEDSRRKIDLRRDVVATEDNLHGSTYLVTKPWVDALTRSCRRNGIRVRIGQTGK